MFQYAKIILFSCGLTFLIHSTFVQTQALSSVSSSSLGGLPVGTVSRYGLNGDHQFLSSLGNAKVGTSERQVLPYVPIPWWLSAPNFYYRPRPIAIRPIGNVRPSGAVRPSVVRPARPTVVRPARPSVVGPASKPTGRGRGGGDSMVENNNSLIGLDLGGLLGGLLGGIGGSGGILG